LNSRGVKPEDGSWGIGDDDWGEGEGKGGVSCLSVARRGAEEEVVLGMT
jgi:hypothetical protein